MNRKSIYTDLFRVEISQTKDEIRSLCRGDEQFFEMMSCIRSLGTRMVRRLMYAQDHVTEEFTDFDRLEPKKVQSFQNFKESVGELSITYFGTDAPLSQLANIIVKDNVVEITPFYLKEIEAITERISTFLPPIVDNGIIYIYSRIYDAVEHQNRLPKS